MENKIFDLLEKVYIDLQETKSDVKVLIVRQDKMDERQDMMDGRLDRIEGSLTRLEIKVEHEISTKIDALFEFRDEALQRFDRIEGKIDNLSEKVDKHDISIQVIQGGKNKKTV